MQMSEQGDALCRGIRELGEENTRLKIEVARLRDLLDKEGKEGERMSVLVLRLWAALEAAAKSLEWIANNGVDDEDPSSLKAYTRNRAAVARAALADEATP
jgi:regulator of replication initiation timing